MNWEHVEFDDGKSQFLPFLVVYHKFHVLSLWVFGTYKYVPFFLN